MKIKLRHLWLLLLLLSSELQAQEPFIQQGVASYYAFKFVGRKTASGERYSHEAMTAAHRTLPFGTLVKVTNLQNHRSLVVRINDRGPFIKGRIIDLSYRAADSLGYIKAGITKVIIEVVDSSSLKQETPKNLADTTYYTLTCDPALSYYSLVPIPKLQIQRHHYEQSIVANSVTELDRLIKALYKPDVKEMYLQAISKKEEVFYSLFIPFNGLPDD